MFMAGGILYGAARAGNRQTGRGSAPRVRMLGGILPPRSIDSCDGEEGVMTTRKAARPSGKKGTRIKDLAVGKSAVNRVKGGGKKMMGAPKIGE